MFRIKLLILLLVSLLVTSCSNNQVSNKNKFYLSEVSGGEDGLNLYNILSGTLRSNGLLSKNSKYKIQSNIRHENESYIVNVNNTTSRTKITSHLEINIIDDEEKCILMSYSDYLSQFYVNAPSINYMSNSRAANEIKLQNTSFLINKFIQKLVNTEMICKLNVKSG